jgi:hypothetical protein
MIGFFESKWQEICLAFKETEGFGSTRQAYASAGYGTTTNT